MSDKNLTEGFVFTRMCVGKDETDLYLSVMYPSCIKAITAMMQDVNVQVTDEEAVSWHSPNPCSPPHSADWFCPYNQSRIWDTIRWKIHTIDREDNDDNTSP